MKVETRGKYKRVIHPKCVMCGLDKTPNNNLRCITCNREYRNWDKNKKVDRPINYKLIIKNFIDKVESNGRNISLYDINDIISYHNWVSKYAYQFDNIRNPGLQIQKMYNLLLNVIYKGQIPFIDIK